jgi:hypothetical protein
LGPRVGACRRADENGARISTLDMKSRGGAALQ